MKQVNTNATMRPLSSSNTRATRYRDRDTAKIEITVICESRPEKTKNNHRFNEKYLWENTVRTAAVLNVISDNVTRILISQGRYYEIHESNSKGTLANRRTERYIGWVPLTWIKFSIKLRRFSQIYLLGDKIDGMGIVIQLETNDIDIQKFLYNSIRQLCPLTSNDRSNES